MREERGGELYIRVFNRGRFGGRLVIYRLLISFDGDAKKWLGTMGLRERGSSEQFVYIPYRIFSAIEYLYYRYTTQDMHLRHIKWMDGIELSRTARTFSSTKYHLQRDMAYVWYTSYSVHLPSGPEL